MSGLWAQRFFQQFLGDMETENFGKGITFEMFLMLNFKYLRAGPENFDRMIFDIFDLGSRELISVKDLSQMLLTLPPQAVISGLNAEIKVNSQTDDADELLRVGYDYRIVRAPEDFSTIFLNKKLLVRVEDQEQKPKLNIDGQIVESADHGQEFLPQPQYYRSKSCFLPSSSRKFSLSFLTPLKSLRGCL